MVSPPDGAPDGPVTLGNTGAPGKLAAVGDCIVVAAVGNLSCVPRAGGTVTPIKNLPDRYINELAGDEDAVIITSAGSDGLLHVDRIALDGGVTPLAAVPAGAGAGGLTLAGDRVVFASGGEAVLYAVDHGGGPMKILASDSGNFGDVAVIGTTVYYFNLYIFAQAFDGMIPHGDIVGGGDFRSPKLATDGQFLVAAGENPAGTATTIVVLNGPAIAPISAVGTTRVVAARGTAYLTLGGDIVALDLTTGSLTPVITGENAVDIIAPLDQLVWITEAGAVRMAPR